MNTKERLDLGKLIIKGVIPYNVFIIILVILFELSMGDPTRMGMLFVPFLLVVFTVLHSMVLLYSFLRRRISTLKTYLVATFVMIGGNVAAFWVDILLIVLALTLLHQFGLMWR